MRITKRCPQAGYGLVEISITLLLITILAALAIPNAATAIADMKLRGTASNFAQLIQKARITSIQNNRTYIVRFGLSGANGAYVEDFLNGNSTYDSGEPMVQFGGTANNVAAPGGASGAPTNLDDPSGPLGWTATAGNISFNSRGLPCNASVSPCGANVNYIFYFRDTRYSGSHSWAAVSITAAARSKVWIWNGSSWIN